MTPSAYRRFRRYNPNQFLIWKIGEWWIRGVVRLDWDIGPLINDRQQCGTQVRAFRSRRGGRRREGSRQLAEV
jgi:hypothetical protein